MTTARQVPAMTAALVDYLDANGYWEYMTGWFQSDKPHGIPFTPSQAEAYARIWLDEQIRGIRYGRLFHITEPLLAVARTLRKKLDPDEVWSLDVLPHPSGILWLETPTYFRDVWNRRINITAVAWFRIAEGGKTATQFTFFSDSHDMDDDYNRLMNEDASIEYGQKVGPYIVSAMTNGIDGESSVKEVPLHEIYAYRDSHEDASAERDIPPALDAIPSEDIPAEESFTGIMYAIFSLMSETRMTKHEDYRDKRIARMHDGKRRKRLPSDVTIMVLRREEKYGYRNKETGQWLTYRAWTSAHRRRVRYGPGRKEVKWIWISAYLRGPENAPIINVPRVTTLAK